MRQVIPAEGLHLSLEDIFEPLQSRALDHESQTPSSHSIGSVMPEPPPTSLPDRTPPGLFDSVFTLSPQSVNLELHDGDSQNLSSAINESSSPLTGSSSPASTTSFDFSTRTTEGASTSFDTTLTTPSPTTSISRVSKGKQRAILSEFDVETDTETESNEPGKELDSCPSWFNNVTQCDATSELAVAPAVPSIWHAIEGQREAISSGISLAMAYSKQRADPPKLVPSSVALALSSPGPSHPRQRTNSSPNLAVPRAPASTILNAPPRPLTFMDGGAHSPRGTASLRPLSSSGPSRPRLGRSVSLLKLKLKRSREFLRSGGKVSPSANRTFNRRNSASNVEELSSAASRNASSESLRDSALRKNGVRVRGHTAPPHGEVVTNLRSSTAPPVLTNEDAESTAAEGSTADLKPVVDTRDLFDEVMPVEIRLYIFSRLVQLHIDEHQGLVDAGLWTTARASRLRWVGWEGGIRELIKLSRVSYIGLIRWS